MDFRQLQMFKTVAELGSFTKAGTKLFVSHSAISRQVKLLGEELHSPLFMSIGRQVTLTEAGRVLLPYAEAILNQVADASQRVLDVSQSSLQRVHIGTSTTTLSFFLPPILEEFRKCYPKHPLLVTTGLTDTILEEIHRGTIDIGLVALPFEARRQTVQPLYREEFVIAVGNRHTLAKKRSVRPRELENLPLILYPRGSGFRRTLDNFFYEVGLSPLVGLEVENEEAMEKAAIDGVGIAFLSKHRASRDKLHILRVLEHPLYREVAFVHQTRVGPLPEHLSGFLQLCMRHVRSSVGVFIPPSIT
ncbi:MAG: LysR family transcriptional regulator [Candidatus Sulfotelmatobacter sp.]|jgi:LysR family transcriptional activator of glutamate synthase operon